MATLETMVSALNSIITCQTGAYNGDASLDHCVLVPVVDRPENADNKDYLMYNEVNAEFYISGDYRAKIASARTALQSAGLFVGIGQYVEYISGTTPALSKHHYFLPVTGRA